MVRDALQTVFTVLLVVVTIALVVGQLFGQPVLLGYVTSDSMEPTIETGDGFIAVPSQLTGEPETGDVVVFHAQELNDDGLTTHRVVDVTDGGYITKGNANPFTDQDGGEPPIPDEQIVAVALQANGEVVTIPGLGTAVTAVRNAVLGVQAALATALGTRVLFGMQGAGYLLFATGLLLFVVSFVDGLRGGPTRNRSRSRRSSDALDGRRVVLAMALIVLLPANIAMIAPSGTQQVLVDGDRLAGQVEAGEDLGHEITAANDGIVTMIYVLDTDDSTATIDRNVITLPADESATATMTLSAPPPGEQQVVDIESNRYFLLLPPTVLVELHSVHPLLALAAINLLLSISVIGFVGGIVGFGRTRFRETNRDVPAFIQLKRRFR